MSESILRIDELRLEKACLDQPELYYQWARKLADARLTMDESKANLDLVAGEVNLAIRKSPAEYGLNPDKLTEGQVSAAVPQHKRYRAAYAQFLDARHELDTIQAMVTALEHRKRSLTLLVDLHGQNYWAEPRVTRENRTALNETAKDRVRRLGQRREDGEAR